MHVRSLRRGEVLCVEAERGVAGSQGCSVSEAVTGYRHGRRLCTRETVVLLDAPPPGPELHLPEQLCACVDCKGEKQGMPVTGSQVRGQFGFYQDVAGWAGKYPPPTSKVLLQPSWD